MDSEILIKVALDLKNVKDQVQDMSGLWEKHNVEVQKGSKAMQKQADDTVKSYSNVNKKMKEQIDQVVIEAKAVDQLTKKFENLNKKNSESFDIPGIEVFSKTLTDLSSSFGGLDKLNINTDDIDKLSQKLALVNDDFETLEVLVGFVEEKLKAAGFDTTGLQPELWDAVTASIKEQSKELDSAQGKYVSIGNELQRIKNELIDLELNGERGSDRWIELTNEASKYNEVIRNTNAELNRTSKSTAGLDSLIGAATGIVALFTAAQGAAALFGEENEDLEKSLVKLTGAIALLNGLQQIQLELAKKETIAGKALTFVRLQYATATNGAATATTRLAAASKLLGIGLLVGAVAYLATNWKEVAKWMGITSDRIERINALNKTANESYGEQIAKLTILVDRVKEGGLSFDQKKKAVKDFNEVFGKTLGDVKSYTELEQKLIENGAKYIEYLKVKAKAEAAYQLQVEKTKEALIKRTEIEAGPLDFVKAITGDKTPNEYAQETANIDADKLQKDADKYGDILDEAQKESEALAKSLGIVLDEPIKKIGNDINKFTSLPEDLVKKALDLKNQLIDSDREREKSTLTDSFESEKEKYKKEIELLKVSNSKKLELLQAYNKIYNEETGLAYEAYRKEILKIDQKYDEQAEQLNYTALSAIASAYDQQAILERVAIQEKYQKIREELVKQIALTKDLADKETKESLLLKLDGAEERDLSTFDVETNLDRVDREAEIAESILKIQQSNMRDILKNEKIKQLQLLTLDKETLRKRINVYRDALNDEEKINLFNELTDTLENSIDDDETENAKRKLIEAFGEETALEILKTVGALKDVGKEINAIGSQSKLGSIVSEIAEWTSSLEGFGTKLGESLGLEGEALKDFAQATAQAIDSTFQALEDTFNAEIEQRQAKVDAIQENIDAVEQEVETEKQLYEDGYANNYELRKKDLEDLKAQKAQEEEELKKAQKKKAALNKVEMLGNLAMQASNLITAITAITEAHSGIPFVGIALAVGFIASMFAAIANAKAQAASITGGPGQNFRRGLQEGHLDLHGPRHEERGFGLYNSKTGERVAEFEDSERIYTFNKGQQSKYGYVMEAIIKDAQGRGDFENEIGNHYGIQKTGESTINVVRYVNDITVKAQKAKENSAKDSDDMLNQLKKLNNNFEKEFEGYKKERDDEVKDWQTKDYYFVKKGNVTKKYKKE